MEHDANTSQSLTATTRSELRPKLLSKTAGQDAKNHARPSASTVYSNPPVPTLTLSAFPQINVDSCEKAPVVAGPSESRLPRNAYTGEIIEGIPLSEVGTLSRFGDKTLVQEHRCTVFEVVLQSKEASMCPACTRNPQRAKLPARKCPRTLHIVETLTSYLYLDARGCLGPG